MRLVLLFMWGVAVALAAVSGTGAGRAAEPAAASPEGALFHLTAAQAVGGAVRDGKAAYFPATAGIGDKIVWSLPTPLAAGLWRIEFDFAQPDANFSPNQAVSFQGKDALPLGQLDLYYIGFTKGDYRRSIGLYLDQPATALTLVKTGQRHLDTVGVTGIRVFPAQPAELQKHQMLLHLPVSDRRVPLPFDLLAGVYLTNASAPASLRWTFANGRAVTTPPAAETRIWLDQPVKIELAESAEIRALSLLRYPPTPIPAQIVEGNPPLQTALDATKMEEHPLILAGYHAEQLPNPDFFPEGKSIAIITSWDDGKMMDLPLADSLARFGIKGTFYMNRHSEMNAHLKELEAKGMEVGSHSWSHPPFYFSSPERCLVEAVQMRRFLEQATGHPVISFAYPFNYQPAYDQNGDYVLRSLREAGYWSGRATTAGENSIDRIPEPLAMRPDFHFRAGAARIKARLEAVKKMEGAILYVWGHSYELAGGELKKFDEILAVLSGQPQAWYPTVGELMTWRHLRMLMRLRIGEDAAQGRTVHLSLPWVHPYLRRFPISLRVPAGTSEVLWRGERLAVVNGRVQLKW